LGDPVSKTGRIKLKKLLLIPYKTFNWVNCLKQHIYIELFKYYFENSTDKSRKYFLLVFGTNKNKF
jgi:hypothetical protein